MTLLSAISENSAWAHGQVLVKALKTAGRAREEANAAQLGATDTYNHQHELTWDRGKNLAKNCMTHFTGAYRLAADAGAAPAAEG